MATINQYRKQAKSTTNQGANAGSTEINSNNQNSNANATIANKGSVNINTATQPKLNDYRKVASGSSSNDSSSSQGSTSSSNNYYDLAQKEQWRELLDAEIQLENSKNNALKYASNQIANQGLSSQGYSSSVNAGIYNDYLNAANQANINYQNNMQELSTEQANDRFESVTTMLTQATNVSQMNTLLQDYGYGTVDEDGNFIFSETIPEGMSADDWYQLKYYYTLQKDYLDEGTANDLPTYFDYEDLKWAQYTDSYGTVTNMNNAFGHEIAYIFENKAPDVLPNVNDYQNGDTIMLRSEAGQIAYLTYTGNGWQITDRSTYEKAENKYSVIRNGGKITAYNNN